MWQWWKRRREAEKALLRASEGLSARLVDTEKALARLAREQSKATLLWEQSMASQRETQAQLHEAYQANRTLLGELERTAEERGRLACEDKLVPEIIALADALFQAVAAMNQEAEAQPALADWAAGIQRVHARAEELLSLCQITPIAATGQAFDPMLHRPVEVVDVASVDTPTVIGEAQRGYRRNGRVLRPAAVVVARPAGVEE